MGMSRHATPGPAILPECIYCGDDLHTPNKGYRRGCPSHDPLMRQRAHLIELKTEYGVIREIVRRSSAENVEIALAALDHIYEVAKEATV